MTTTKNISLNAFLKTRQGELAVAAFVGVRSTDPALLFQCRENANHWMPVSVRRTWKLSDLVAVALRVDAAGVYRAVEVAQ